MSSISGCGLQPLAGSNIIKLIDFSLAGSCEKYSTVQDFMLSHEVMSYSSFIIIDAAASRKHRDHTDEEDRVY